MALDSTNTASACKGTLNTRILAIGLVVTNLATIIALACHFLRLITFRGLMTLSTAVVASERTSIVVDIAIIDSTWGVRAAVARVVSIVCLG